MIAAVWCPTPPFRRTCPAVRTNRQYADTPTTRYANYMGEAQKNVFA